MLALLASQLIGLVGRSARAAELEPTVSLQAAYASNPFGLLEAEDGVSLLATPQLRLLNQTGQLSYDLTSRTSYLIYLDEGGADFLNTQARGSASYLFSPRTRFSIADVFDRTSNTTFERQGDGIQTNSNDINLSAQRLISNQLEYSLTHLFTPRLSGEINGSHSLINFDDRERTDNQSVGGSVQLDYAVTARASAGLGGSYYHQTLEGDALGLFVAAPGVFLPFGFLSQRARIAQAFATLAYRFDPTLSLTLQGGPAFVKTISRFATLRDIDPGPGVEAVSEVGRVYGGRTTFFANAQVIKRMERWRGRLTYTRRQSEGTGDGVATAVDRVRGVLDYNGDYWSAFLEASYSLRTRLAGRGNGNADNAGDNFSVGTGFSYRLTRLLAWDVGADYRLQERRRGQVDNWRIFTGLSLILSPLHIEMP